MLGATYVKRHPRTGGYYFRRRVPDHLKPTIGTVEIIRSLATKSLDEAKRRSRTLADATDALFDEAEGREGSGETVSQPAGWHSEFIAKWLESVSGRRGDAAPASAPIVVSLPPEASAQPPETPHAVTPPAPVQQLPPQPQPILPPQRIATVRDVFDRYLSEFDRRPRTEQAWRRHVDMFLELSGLSWETNIHTVNDAHVENFILALRKMPSRRQGAKFKKLTLMQIIEKFGACADIAKLDQRSINVKVDALRAVFYYAQRHKYRTDNPFVGKVSKRAAKRVKPKPRLPFDADELAMIFGSNIFQMPPHQWEGKQWLAVIALYTHHLARDEMKPDIRGVSQARFAAGRANCAGDHAADAMRNHGHVRRQDDARHDLRDGCVGRKLTGELFGHGNRVWLIMGIGQEAPV